MTNVLETPTPKAPAKTIEILMVEDNSNDVFFMQLALRRDQHAIRVKTAADGLEAMDYLRRQEKRGLLPDLILLDLSLPGKDGWQVLAELKEDPILGRIPVIVVSGSNSVKDVLHAREMESDFYLVKPMDMVDFSVLPKVVGQILGQTHPDPQAVED